MSSSLIPVILNCALIGILSVAVDTHEGHFLHWIWQKLLRIENVSFGQVYKMLVLKVHMS